MICGVVLIALRGDLHVFHCSTSVKRVDRGMICNLRVDIDILQLGDLTLYGHNVFLDALMTKRMR